MTTLSLRLPESLHARLRELARREGVSINQFITLAVAEKTSALLVEEVLNARARRGDRGRFDAALSQVAEAPPPPWDTLPAPPTRRRVSRRGNPKR
jgi:hypothetical protein